MMLENIMNVHKLIIITALVIVDIAPGKYLVQESSWTYIPQMETEPSLLFTIE